ncbi:MAG TPA: Ig-like domain-containing protein, partial [Gemmatimonadaceae bacterium]|nr:Ig-like domain-containing protein [Gemmatimonadaceae bacterium]
MATVSVTLNASSLVLGQTTQAAAVARDGSGTVIAGATIAWSSSDASVATVSGSGLVTAVGGGTAAIVATSDGKTGSQPLSVTVLLTPVATVSLTTNVAALTIGQTVQVGAMPYDASGNPLTGRVITWTSSATGVASVTSQGLVAAVAAGSATVTAASEGKSATVAVTVTAPAPPPPPAAPAGIAILPGQSIQAIVDANPAGATFILKSGTHVRQNVVPKDGDVFR